MAKETQIRVRVNTELRQQLEALAAQEQRTLSNMVRVLLQEALRAREGNQNQTDWIRRSYGFASFLHNFNTQNGTHYRPSDAPQHLVEQFENEATQ